MMQSPVIVINLDWLIEDEPVNEEELSALQQQLLAALQGIQLPDGWRLRMAVYPHHGMAYWQSAKDGYTLTMAEVLEETMPQERLQLTPQDAHKVVRAVAEGLELHKEAHHLWRQSAIISLRQALDVLIPGHIRNEATEYLERLEAIQ